MASKFEKDLDKFAKKLGSVFELATAVGAIDDYADAMALVASEAAYKQTAIPLVGAPPQILRVY